MRFLNMHPDKPAATRSNPWRPSFLYRVRRSTYSAWDGPCRMIPLPYLTHLISVLMVLKKQTAASKQSHTISSPAPPSASTQSPSPHLPHEMPSPLPPTSRILGSLYGVAIADALGGPVEFRPRGSFPWVSSFRYNPNFDLAPGTWTDDTSMTFCLAQSLVETRAAFSTQDQVRKYIDWFENGYMSATGKCFDIGNATRVSLGIWGDWIRGKGKEGITSDEEMEEGQALVDRSLKRKVRLGVSFLFLASQGR